MTTQLKTQLSLILLAGVGALGLVGFLMHSVHKDFALLKGPDPSNIYTADNTQNSPSVAAAQDASAGAVLGASDNPQVNPLQGIYVNPFSSLKGIDTSAVAISQSGQGEAVVLSALQPKPTAPIQIYLRGYVYPIVELSNCSSGQACYNFCEQLANLPLCGLFSQRQGFMKPEMVAVTQRLAVGLLSDSNFAGCGTAGRCVQLCDQPSSSDTCAALANNYQLNSRVLGASDGITASGDVAAITPSNDISSANPYANLNMNYSGNPALSKYIASTTGSGCPPLDMLCLSQSSQSSSNPRVLNMSIDPGNGDGGGNLIDPVDTTNYNNCLANASSGVINQDPALLPPEAPANAAAQLIDCGKNYGQTAVANAAANAEAKKQETLSDIGRFEACVSGSKNIAVDIQRCINQELR